MSGLDDACRRIDSLLTGTIREMGIPGLAMAITNRERLLGTKTYGVTDTGTKSLVSEQSIFEIGSLGKPFTSIVLLQLVEEGLLELHAPVSDYLPWFEVRSEHPPITVHHLLNHTSGLVRGTDLAPHGLYESWALRFRKTNLAPGEFFWYSNVGYKTLGFLVEYLTGLSLDDAIRQRILEPLGMKETHPAITAEMRALAATGYTSIFDDRPEHTSHALVPAIWTEYATGDGAQASTVSDMAIYLRMLLSRGSTPHGRILSELSFQSMSENGIWTGGDDYAYGLASYSVDGRRYIGHGGGNAGFRSALVVDMEAGLGVIMLLNRMGETDPIVEIAQQALTLVRRAQLGEALPPLPHSPENRHVSDAAEYAGDYHCGEKILKIRIKDSSLWLFHSGETIALEYRTGDDFHANHPDFSLALFQFRRQNGVVVELFHGGDWYTNARYTGPIEFEHPKQWSAFVGHYRARNPELSNFRIVIRKGQLVLLNPWGNTEPLTPLGEAKFRISEYASSPETLQFDAIVNGGALRADFSGCSYYRTFTP